MNLILAQAEGTLYPRRCPFCDRVLGKVPDCSPCAESVKKLYLHPFRLSPQDHCLEGLDGAASVFHYAGAVREAVHRMKYSGRACYCAEMGRMMAQSLFDCTFSMHGGIIKLYSALPAALEYDVIVPVPASDAKRGFNPPQRIAAVLADALGLPLVPEALIKTRSTPRQHTLSRQERLVNLTGAFRADPEKLPENARVLLVDDVITTGGTVTACAAALRKAGAHSAFAVSLAATQLADTQERIRRQASPAGLS